MRGLRSYTTPRALQSYGTRQLFSGLRKGSATSSSLGTALLVLAWLRSHQAPRKELLYAANLREGQALQIRLVRDGSVVDEAEVEA